MKRDDAAIPVSIKADCLTAEYATCYGDLLRRSYIINETKAEVIEDTLRSR